MAAYPSSIGLTHDIRPQSKIKLDVSDSGTIRGVDLGEDTVYLITIKHPYISESERDTLRSFFDLNKVAANTITLAGDTYTVYFAADYRIESVSATMYHATATLNGTRN